MSFIPLFGARLSSAHRLGRMTCSSHGAWRSKIARLAAAGLALLVSAPACLHAQTAYFSGVTSTISTGFTSPYDMSLDSHGNLYIADFGSGQVLEMTTNGNGGFNGPAPVPTATTFTYPGDVAVDAAGDVFVSDYGGQVWEIPAHSTPMRNAIRIGSAWEEPSALVLDSQGRYLFVSDFLANTVTRIQLSDLSTQGVNNQFTSPAGLALDPAGNLYVVETGTVNDGTVQRIPSAVAASPSTFATTPPAQVGTTSFNYPTGISIDASGNLWIAESDGPAIREMLASDNYATVKTWGSGYMTPIGVVWDPTGNVIVADSDTTVHAIEQIATGGVNFGSLAVGASSSSTPITLQFTFSTGGTGVAPSVVAQGKAGADFRIDSTTPGTCQSNGTGHTYNVNETCTVIADFDPAVSGTRYGAVQLAGATGYVYGTGTGPQITYNLPPNFVPGTTKTPLPGTFSNPSGLAVDGSGNVYVADPLHGTVQEISGGSASLIGTGFTTPVSVALDGAGDVFVADSGLKEVFEIVAGSGATNQLASTYTFSNPKAIAVDANGNVYVADTGSGKVVEILAGSQYTVSNVLSSAFTAPDGIAVDSVGNLYVADSSTSTVYELAAGNATPTVIASSFSSPAQVAIDGNGNLFVADSGNNAIKEVLAGTSTPFALDSVATFTGPLGVTVDGLGNVYVANSGANQVFELDYSDTPGLTFAAQEDGTNSDPQSVQVVNDGNTTALTNVGTGVSLVSGSNYTLQGGGADCSSTFSLNAGASCNVTVEFTPVASATGVITDAVTLTDNNLNASPSAQQTINLSGTAVNLQITSPASTTLPNGTVGVAYGPITFSASGGRGTGYTWGATGLPAGLSLDSTTGVLSGTPTAVASATTVSVTATDSGTGSSGVQMQKNYTLTVVAGTVTVNWTPPSSIIYGADLTTILTASATDGSAVPGTFAYTAKLNPSGTTNTVSASTVLSVGSYTLIATFNPNDTTDYNTPVPVQVSLTVNAAVLTVTANNATRAYGAGNPAFTATITGFVNSDPSSVVTGTPAFSTTATATSPVGPYSITPSIGTLSAANYTFTFVNGTLSITQATLTVTANNATRVYGAANPTFTAAITGFVNGDSTSAITGSPAFSTTATATSPVGSYPITPALGTLAATNYAFAFVNGTLTVSPATLTVTANNATRAYGAANPTFTAAITGFVNGDSASVVTGSSAFSTTATAASPVGSYPITPAVGTLAATNYTFVFVNGTLTITQAAPVISWAAPAPITYGTPLSSTQLDATSAVAGTFVYTPPAGTVLNVGAGQTLSVTLTPTDATDYSSATTTVTINVVGGAPVITFSVPNHTYGDGPFAVTATSNSTGAFTYSVVSGPATISGNAVTLTGAGTLVLQASEAAAGNYVAGTAQTTIVVAKQASHTAVTTNAASVRVGQPVTLTAAVTPAVLGTPTGTVTFFSGTTQLGSPVTLTNGMAQLVVSTLASGSDAISATYSGDANFLLSSGSLSGGVTVTPLSFTLSASPSSQSGFAGLTYAYDVTVTPTNGVYPGTVTFAASGLPSGASAVFTPSTLAANAGQQTIGMAIVTASTTSSLRTIPVGQKLAPVALALLLLPLAGTRRMRRQGQRFGRFLCLLLLAVAGVAATAALTGCGTSGYIHASPQNYTITITGTSGGVQQATTVSLSLQ